ncbi:hypothetical protein ADUPG1_004262, partial [Aduncisulcus paluster]
SEDSRVGVKPRLFVLKSDDSRPPRGEDFVHQLKDVSRDSIVEFCQKCLEAVNSDHTLVLPCLGSLIKDDVLDIISTITKTDFDVRSEDQMYIVEMLQQIVSAYVGQNVFEAFLVDAKEVKCDCDSDCSEGELAVTLDQSSRYALEWKRLVKKHVGSKWTEIQRKRAATAFIRGLRPLSFSDKVMEDVDDWRRYGVTQNSDDPTKPVINSDDVKGVSDYAIALVQEARFHRMRGQSSVGQVLAEVSSHKRRS